MAAEVLFQWNGQEVNLRLARRIVRHLAENHPRLVEVGTAQSFRDILAWVHSTGNREDEPYRELRRRFGQNRDYGGVIAFMRAFSYDEMRRQYPSQHNSLWNAVRGVVRQRKSEEQAAQEEESPPSSPPPYDPFAAITDINESAGEIALDAFFLQEAGHTDLPLNALRDLAMAIRSFDVAKHHLEAVLANHGTNSEHILQSSNPAAGGGGAGGMAGPGFGPGASGGGGGGGGGFFGGGGRGMGGPGGEGSELGSPSSSSSGYSGGAYQWYYSYTGTQPPTLASSAEVASATSAMGKITLDSSSQRAGAKRKERSTGGEIQGNITQSQYGK